jgi:hypothetical protein
MRITSRGHMQSYIAFALSHLKVPSLLRTRPSQAEREQDHPETPLTLHNVPVANESSTPAGVAKVVTSSLYRLVSVVELIKREYTKAVDAEMMIAEGDVAETANSKVRRKKRARLAAEPGRPRHLHQYNDLTCLEDLGLLPAQNVGADAMLDIVRDGRQRPKKRHTPVLQVTLSPHELSDLMEKRTVTCVVVLGVRCHHC